MKKAYFLYCMIVKITKNSYIKNIVIHNRETLLINNKNIKGNDVLIFYCERCGSLTKQGFGYKKRFLEYNFICGKCASKQTRLERYGDENYNNVKKANRTQIKRYGCLGFNTDKQKQTMLKKYGAESSFQSKKLIEKIKITKLKKYNSYNNVKEIKKTNLKKHGYESHLKSPKIRSKIIKTRNKIFYDNLINSDRLQNKVTPLFSAEDYKGVDKLYKWKCNKCDNEFEDHLDDGHIPRCHQCFPKCNSKYEKELFNWIQSLNINVKRNNRDIIHPYEIDLYLPDYKLAIEFNGLYWHSIEFITDKWYHQKKVELCHRKGIRLLHIWENEWSNSKHKILYYINNINEKIKVRKPIFNIIDGYKIWY